MYGLDMQSISADEEDEFYTESTTATRVASEIFSPRPANHPVHKKGGRYATVGAGEALSPQLEDDASYNTKIVRETDLNLPTEGLILGRLSVRYPMLVTIESYSKGICVWSTDRLSCRNGKKCSGCCPPTITKDPCSDRIRYRCYFIDQGDYIIRRSIVS